MLDTPPVFPNESYSANTTFEPWAPIDVGFSWVWVWVWNISTHRSADQQSIEDYPDPQPLQEATSLEHRLVHMQSCRKAVQWWFWRGLCWFALDSCRTPLTLIHQTVIEGMRLIGRRERLLLTSNLHWKLWFCAKLSLKTRRNKNKCKECIWREGGKSEWRKRETLEPAMVGSEGIAPKGSLVHSTQEPYDNRLCGLGHFWSRYGNIKRLFWSPRSEETCRNYETEEVYVCSEAL